MMRKLTLRALARLRATPRTALVPVVILASSQEDRPVDFTQFVEAVRQLGLYWLVLNEPPPTRPS